MQNNDFRAKQFLPFDSLPGYREYLHNIEKISIEKKELSDDLNNIINDKLNSLSIGSNICIKHYIDLDYIETIGKVKKIDKTYKVIYLLNSKINFDDILDIEIL